MEIIVSIRLATPQELALYLVECLKRLNDLGLPCANTLRDVVTSLEPDVRTDVEQTASWVAWKLPKL